MAPRPRGIPVVPGAHGTSTTVTVERHSVWPAACDNALTPTQSVTFLRAALEEHTAEERLIAR